MMKTNFGQLLEQKRREAGLSIEELAGMAKLTPSTLQDLEQGWGELPSFDTCYRLSQAITARGGRLFVLQDFWQALKSDRHALAPEILLRQDRGDQAA